MAPDSDFAAAHAFILQTYSYSTCLMRDVPAAAGSSVPENQSLGGQLFWAGELDETGRALTVAANIAGAATLAATSDAEAQRQAVRDGVVDFLVNSLDEALRILKNEVRKRETVAVCVAAPVEAVEREMTERGVRPDVLREGVVRAAEQPEPGGNSQADPMSVRALVAWRVDRAPALWLPKLDAIALECLAPEESSARRWLLRSSRYLGRIGQTEHLVWSNRAFAARMFERCRDRVDRDEIKVSGRVEALFSGVIDILYFGPREDEKNTAPQA